MTIASEITRLQGAKADIKTAIENKGVTVPSADTIDQYAGYIDQIETGTTIVNGVIKNYLASTSTVDAGTFVEFVNTIGTRTQFDGSGTTINAEAVALEDGKVFVAFRKGSTGDRYAVIATISGGVVSFGTEVLLSTNTTQSYSDTYVSASPDKSKVLVSWRSSSTEAAVIACEISGSSIEVGTEETQNQFYALGVAWLDNNKAFWAGYKSSTGYGVVINVADDLSITMGTATAIVSSENKFDFAVLTGSSVLAVTSTLYAFSCSISGYTISATNKVFVSGLSYTSSYKAGFSHSVIRINDTDIAYIVVGSLSNTTLGTMVWSARVSISNGSPVLVACGSLFGGSFFPVYSSTTTGAVLFEGSDGPYAVIDHNSGYLKLAKLRPAISGVVIKEIQAITTGSSLNAYGGAIIGANGLLFYGSSTTLNAYPLVAEVKPAEIEVSGFTKTEATTSTPGEVWVLNS